MSQDKPTKVYMRAHWTNYCTVIRDEWLGPNWQEDHNHEYINMWFCKPGREDETPKEFIQCWILYARMLLSHEPRSQVEIRDVLCTAPPAWLVILNVETIPCTGILQAQVTQHEAALIAVVGIQASQSVTVESLPTLLRNLGISASSPSVSCPFCHYKSSSNSLASAHIAAVFYSPPHGLLMDSS